MHGVKLTKNTCPLSRLEYHFGMWGGDVGPDDFASREAWASSFLLLDLVLRSDLKIRVS